MEVLFIMLLGIGFWLQIKSYPNEEAQKLGAKWGFRIFWGTGVLLALIVSLTSDECYEYTRSGGTYYPC